MRRTFHRGRYHFISLSSPLAAAATAAAIQFNITCVQFISCKLLTYTQQYTFDTLNAIRSEPTQYTYLLSSLLTIDSHCLLYYSWNLLNGKAMPHPNATEKNPFLIVYT